MMIRILLLVSTILMNVIPTSAQSTNANRLQLAGIFGDSMVLQRNAPIKVWGWAKPGEMITVHFHQQQKQTKADTAGAWMAILSPEAAGGPYNLQVKGTTTITLKGILMGDIWVCSGQSNMEMPLQGWGSIYNAEQEIASANYPAIRLFTVERNVQGLPATDVKGGAWQSCNPQSIPPFSAVGYFFGRELHQQLKVPIGLINASWGGTDIESWISRNGFTSEPYYLPLLNKTPAKSTSEMLAIREQKDHAYIARLKIDTTGLPQWKNADYDDSKWPQMTLPDLWEHQQPGPQFDGVIWFRKEIVVDNDVESATLQLAKIDDNDETYVNGVRVGGINGWNVLRTYRTALKKGKNSIAVRVEDTGGGGGIYGEPGELSLIIDGKTISLAGPWKFHIQGAKMSNNGLGPNDYPSVLYNGMIHPIEQLPVKGVIWYQGENNAWRAVEYRKAMPLLIKDWRSRWHQPNMPFYFVQLASFQAHHGNSNKGSEWAELREAQAMTTKVPNTGMAVTIDIGDAKDIHPRNKQDVGKRLAAAALQKTYGITMGALSPEYKSMQATGNTIVLQFSSPGKGLVPKPAGAAINGFEIAGADQKFYPAKAVITGTSVVVSAAEVPQPVAVRYAWADDAGNANLFNANGFPVAPFRTDQWKPVTEKNKYTPPITF